MSGPKDTLSEEFIAQQRTRLMALRHQLLVQHPLNTFIN